MHDDPVDASSGAFNELYIPVKKDAVEQKRDLDRRVELARRRAAMPTQGDLSAGALSWFDQQRPRSQWGGIDENWGKGYIK